MSNKQKIIDDKANEILATFGTPHIAAVLVRDDGATVLTAVQGVRDITKSSTAVSNQAVSADYFNVGSISKPIFGFILACYIEKGVLSWKTRVGDVFPEFREKAFRDRCGMNENFLEAMVYELMAHTSGIGGTYYFSGRDNDDSNGDGDPFRFMSDSWFSRSTNPRGPEWKTDAALRYQRYLYAVLCMKKQRYHYSGKKNFRYENLAPSGYTSCSTICAAMLERKTGKSFETLMDDLLRDDVTLYVRRGRLPGGMAFHGWDTATSKFVTLPYMNDDFANYGPKFMTGGMHATVQGMAGFIRYNLRALDHSAIFSILGYQKPVTNVARGGLYLGRETNGDEFLWHTGHTDGSNAVVHIYPHLGYGFAVMQNCSGGPVVGNVDLSWRAANAMDDALRDIHRTW